MARHMNLLIVVQILIHTALAGNKVSYRTNVNSYRCRDGVCGSGLRKTPSFSGTETTTSASSFSITSYGCDGVTCTWNSPKLCCKKKGGVNSCHTLSTAKTKFSIVTKSTSSCGIGSCSSFTQKCWIQASTEGTAGTTGVYVGKWFYSNSLSSTATSGFASGGYACYYDGAEECGDFYASKLSSSTKYFCCDKKKACGSDCSGPTTCNIAVAKIADSECDPSKKPHDGVDECPKSCSSGGGSGDWIFGAIVCVGVLIVAVVVSYYCCKGGSGKEKNKKNQKNRKNQKQEMVAVAVVATAASNPAAANATGVAVVTPSV